MYIREAHPSDGWALPGPNRGIDVLTHKTTEDRKQAASQCVASLKLNIPTLIDGMDDAVSKAYAGWPDRLFVVGKHGKIAFAAAPGPWGFKPDEMEAALRKELGLPAKSEQSPGSSKKGD